AGGRGGYGCSCDLVELRVVAKDAVLVELEAARRGEVCREARPGGDPLAQRERERDARRQRAKSDGRGVGEAGYDLEEGEVGDAGLVADEPAGTAARQQVLEVGQELRHALGGEVV